MVAITSTFVRDAEGVVVLAFAPQPMDFLSKASKLCGKDAILDPDVARMAGANIAAGSPKALAALREKLAAGAVKAAGESIHGLGLPTGAAEWLGAGERGISSNTMFTVLTGMDAMGGNWQQSHPLDLSDLRRCRLLLEAVPSLQHSLPHMRTASAQWSALVDVWPEICRTMDEEEPDWRTTSHWSCPRTRDLMKTAIGR